MTCSMLQGNPMQEPSGIYDPIQGSPEDEVQSRYQGLLSLLPGQPQAPQVRDSPHTSGLVTYELGWTVALHVRQLH